MPSFPSPCPNGKFRLAAKTNVFPYFFEKDGQYDGVFMEFWRTIATILECDTVEVEEYKEIRFCNGSMCTPFFDGAVDRQEIFSPALPVFLIPGDPSDYKYSVNVNWWRMQFYESVPREGMFTKASSIEFYTVFPIWMLATFFALRMISALLFNLIDIIRKRHSSDPPLPLQAANAVAHICIIVAFYFVNAVYQSYFNGNNILFEERTQSLLSSMAAQVASGKRNVLFETGSTQFDNEDLFNMFGSSKVGIYIDSVLDRLTMTCRNHSIVGFFFDVDQLLLSITPSLQDCVLSGIAPDGLIATVPWLSNTMTNGDPYNFVFSRNVSTRVIEKINFALLSVYTEENLNGFFAFRAMSFSELRRSMKYMESITPQSTAIARAISLTSLGFPLIFLAIGLGCSSVSLVIENVCWKCLETRAR